MNTTALKTALLITLATATCAVANTGNLDLPEENGKIYRDDAPGYSYYLYDAPVEALDETVESFPEFEENGLFLSKKGLFRYAYFEKTGTWVTSKQSDQALKDPYDEGNW